MGGRCGWGFVALPKSLFIRGRILEEYSFKGGGVRQTEARGRRAKECLTCLRLPHPIYPRLCPFDHARAPAAWRARRGPSALPLPRWSKLRVRRMWKDLDCLTISSVLLVLFLGRKFAIRWIFWFVFRFLSSQSSRRIKRWLHTHRYQTRRLLSRARSHRNFCSMSSEFQTQNYTTNVGK